MVAPALQHPRIVSAPHHPRRIVSANRQKKVFRRRDLPNPQLSYNNGPLIENVHVITVYWGNVWNDQLEKQHRNKLENFFSYIVASPLIDQLGEYSTNGYTIGHGTHDAVNDSYIITDSAPSPTVSDTDIQNMLQAEIQAGNVPSFDVNTLYFVLTPPNTTVEMGGGASCSSFCGYHDNISGQIFYAVLPFPDCSGCIGNLADSFEASTVVGSHELCEAITDPIPGRGWYDPNYGEIGDICEGEGNVKRVGDFVVQLEWSNQQNNCM
jgi:hypothetical protein